MSKKTHFPTKTTLNLMILESPAQQLKRMAPLAVAFAIVLAAFTKFAVVDRIVEADRLKNEAESAERYLRQMEAELEDYDSVLMEYTRYFSGTLGSGKELMPLNCMQTIAFIEKNIMSRTSISSIKFEANTVAIQLTGSTLEQASLLVEKLHSLPEVAAITLFKANAENADEPDEAVDIVVSDYYYNEATILLTITFQEVYA